MSLIRSFPALALIAALAAPLAAGAQTAPPPAPAAGDAAHSSADGTAPGVHHGRRHHHASFMHALRAVNLTPAQQQQVAAFHDQEKRANLHADDAARKVNAKTMRDQIMGILTGDQKTQLSTELHRSHHMMTQGAGAPNPAPAPRPN